MPVHWSCWTVALYQGPPFASHCTHGYDMAATVWQLLFIDDDPDFYRQVQEFLDGETIPPDDRLQDLLRNNRRDSQSERFFFLPDALSLPDLLVDFQQLEALQREHMHGLERLASLDSPFAEALLARFTRYFGRLGTPDLDVTVLLQRLRAVPGERTA